MKHKKAYAERDGNQIYGVMYIPQDAGGQMPAVIFAAAAQTAKAEVPLLICQF